MGSALHETAGLDGVLQKTTMGTMVGLPTKKSKVLRFQICCTRTMYLSEIYKDRSIKVGAAKLFSVNSSRT